MKELVIFGIGEQAEVAFYYFDNHSEYTVTAFCVDSGYMTKSELFGRPVVAFETLGEQYPPEEYALFVAIGYSKVNKVREEKYLAAKAKGYDLASYISSKATLYTDLIGENCFILEDNTIQPYVRIGNNVTLWSGNHIGHHAVIGDNCFITSHVVVSGGVEVGRNSFIGVNATLRDHIRIGESNVIGAGALILSDTSENQVYMEKATDASRVPSNRLRGI